MKVTTKFWRFMLYCLLGAIFTVGLFLMLLAIIGERSLHKSSHLQVPARFV